MMNIYEAITSIMQKGYAIAKDSTNDMQHFKYRGIDAVMNTFQPLMADAGIFAVPEVLEERREERQSSKGGLLIYTVMKVRYTFYASDGSNVSATVVGEGMDSGDKSANKAMSVAMKYAMFQVFCIPTEEMIDPDSESYEVASKQKPEPKKETNPNEEPKKEQKSIICEGCKKAIESFVDAKTGKEFFPAYIANNSQKKYGKVLCAKCSAKAKGEQQ